MLITLSQELPVQPNDRRLHTNSACSGSLHFPQGIGKCGQMIFQVKPGFSPRIKDKTMLPPEEIKTEVTVGFNPVCDSCQAPFLGSQVSTFNNSLGFNF